MDTGIAALKALGKLVEIGKRGLYKAYAGLGTQARNLVGVPCSNDYLVSLFQKGTDHIVTDKTRSAGDKYSHKNLSVSVLKIKSLRTSGKRLLKNYR